LKEHYRQQLEWEKQEYDLFELQTKQCLKQMRQICSEHYSKEVELIRSIPGVSEISAMIIIAETGGDMSVFENSGKITGWAGLRPRNDESAGKYNISTGSITNRNNQRQQISSFYFSTGIMGGIKNKKRLVQRKV